MTRDVCTTCGQSVRDRDEQPVGAVTALPAHGCGNPVGSMPWNDGRHVVTDDQQRWAPIIGAALAEVDKHGLHGAQVPDDFGPATSADLLELDAVPEPVDSDAPTDMHARTLARARP